MLLSNQFGLIIMNASQISKSLGQNKFSKYVKRAVNFWRQHIAHSAATRRWELSIQQSCAFLRKPPGKEINEAAATTDASRELEILQSSGCRSTFLYPCSADSVASDIRIIRDLYQTDLHQTACMVLQSMIHRASDRSNALTVACQAFPSSRTGRSILHDRIVQSSPTRAGSISCGSTSGVLSTIQELFQGCYLRGPGMIIPQLVTGHKHGYRGLFSHLIGLP